MKTYARFGALAAAIIGTLVWLAWGGINETKTYYKTISELSQMGDKALQKRLKVGGNVVSNIERNGNEVTFLLAQDARQLKIVYSGIEPIPDTLRNGAQAVADGRLGPDGVFHANKLQAKCASKYEAKPGQQRAPVKPGAATL
jgi:cytochrome c-type biogenesis protein CcmE